VEGQLTRCHKHDVSNPFWFSPHSSPSAAVMGWQTRPTAPAEPPRPVEARLQVETLPRAERPLPVETRPPVEVHLQVEPLPQAERPRVDPLVDRTQAVKTQADRPRADKPRAAIPAVARPRVGRRTMESQGTTPWATLRCSAGPAVLRPRFREVRGRSTVPDKTGCTTSTSPTTTTRTS